MTNRFLLLSALSGILLAACTAAVSTEEIKTKCEAFQWEEEQRDCYRQSAIDACDTEICALLDNESLQTACGRAVERACK